jgi:hypothetical protein
LHINGQKKNTTKMDLQNARTLMRKANALFKSIEEAGSQPSAIERDLMLSYLRQLYGLFLEETQQKATETAKEADLPRPRAEKPLAPTPVEPTSSPAKETPAQPAPEPFSFELPKREAPVPPVVEAPAPPPRVERQEPLAAPARRGSVGLDPGLAKLLNFNKATELSERLSESPVADLNKAMSINDRLLYINELFGRDRTALDESLQLLNRFDAFEAARGFLINLAEQYRWGHEERIEIAQAFVKLVRRKYL